MLGVLPNQDKDDTYDFVIRPSIGRAILARSSSAAAASQILATIEANKTNRMMTFFSLAMQFNAQRAEQKAKLSAQHAEQKVKLSAERAAQPRAIMDHAARLRQQRFILRAQHPASRATFVKGVSIAASLAAAGVGLAMWNRRESTSKCTHGTFLNKATWKREPFANVVHCAVPSHAAAGHSA